MALAMPLRSAALAEKWKVASPPERSTLRSKSRAVSVGPEVSEPVIVSAVGRFRAWGCAVV